MTITEMDGLKENIFNASLAGAAICLTVITLFTVTNKRDLFIADEIFALSNCLFILVSCLSFNAFTKDYSRVFNLAYVGFWLALVLLLLSSVSLFFMF